MIATPTQPSAAPKIASAQLSEKPWRSVSAGALLTTTTGSTQIEVVSFAGVDSRPRRARDFEAVGLVALRFPVRSLTALRKRLSLANYPYETATILLPPYGETTGIRVRSPEGARLEFFTLESTVCR